MSVSRTLTQCGVWQFPKHMVKTVLLVLAVALTGCASSTNVIRSYDAGLSAVRSANPQMKLSTSRDPAVTDGAVLVVDYPAATGNPAGRDVWCETERTDWSSGRAISFQAKADHAMRLSVSFMDRNGVAYTGWTDLRGGEWQTVRIAFAQIRPNPYFQPPGAKTGAPLDVSEVKRIGFAPQDPGAGRIAISRFVVSSAR
jgi:Carbohydrate binding domain (family 11)